MKTSMEYLLRPQFPWKLVEVGVLPWKLEEAFREIHRSFHSRWTWKLPLLPSMHLPEIYIPWKLTWASIYPYITSIFHEYHKFPAPSTRLPSGSTDFRMIYFHGSFHQLRWELPQTSTNSHAKFRRHQFTSIETSMEVVRIIVASIEISMEVGESRFSSIEVSGSFHWSTWKFPLSMEVEASIASIIAASSTNMFRGSFHEVPYTPTYFHLRFLAASSILTFTLTLTLSWSYLHLEAGLLPTFMDEVDGITRTWTKFVASMGGGAACMEAGLLEAYVSRWKLSWK